MNLYRKGNRNAPNLRRHLIRRHGYTREFMLASEYSMSLERMTEIHRTQHGRPERRKIK